MQAVLSKKTPEFEMLPVVAANYYPFEMGSFKPYTHFRVGIKEDEGVFVNITAYQQRNTLQTCFIALFAHTATVKLALSVQRGHNDRIGI